MPQNQWGPKIIKEVFGEKERFFGPRMNNLDREKGNHQVRQNPCKEAIQMGFFYLGQASGLQVCRGLVLVICSISSNSKSRT